MMQKSILSAALIILLSGCETSRSSPPRERTAEPATSEVAPPRPTSDKTIRIAAWNIENLGQSKMKKPAVMQEIAAIVRKYDVVAVCEVSDKKEQAPKELLRVINEGSLPAYDYRLSERTGKQGNDKKAQEQYAYFFNTATVKQEGQKGLFPDDEEDLFEREPFLARFKTVEGNFSFVLAVIHTKPDRKITLEEISALHKVNEWAKKQYKDEDDFITLGDFNAGDTYVKAADWPGCLFRTSAYTWIVPDDARTNFAESQAHDRIVFKEGTKEDYAGEWAVDKAFTDEAVSDHFPVWAKFNVSKDTNRR